jgi:hypothetical protein
MQINVNRDVQDFFQASVRADLEDGKKIKFETDNWIGGRSMLTLAPTAAHPTGTPEVTHLGASPGRQALGPRRHQRPH